MTLTFAEVTLVLLLAEFFLSPKVEDVVPEAEFNVKPKASDVPSESDAVGHRCVGSVYPCKGDGVLDQKTHRSVW